MQIGNENFAADFVDHGADVPPGMPPGPAGAIQYVSGALQRFPDLHVQIEDMIAEDDKVVVRNRWTATDSQTGRGLRSAASSSGESRPGRLWSAGRTLSRRMRLDLTASY